jgi:hypothetical protein
MAEGGPVRVRLAPNWFAAIARSFLLLGAMVVVGGVILGVNGPTESRRDVRRNEIALFAPRPLQGIAELGEQMLLIVVLAWACRGPLKIRL